MYGACFGLDRELALRLGTAFSGGMARQGELCGALSGALMVIGLRHGRVDAADTGPRETAFDLVYALMDLFEAQHGCRHCNELLGADLDTTEGYQWARENDLFKTRCPAFVRTAAECLEILLDFPEQAGEPA